MDASAVGFGLAFAAGLVSFLSPCVFPVVPGYVAFVTGQSLEGVPEGEDTALAPAAARGVRRRAALHSALFVAGFSAVFLALGASATLVGSLVRDALPLLQRVGGVVIIVFGLFLLGVLRLPLLLRERRIHLASKPAGAAGSMVAGVAFGAGWTPCIGPVLATLLFYAGFEETMGRGMLLLGAYALGLGIPFFLAAVLLNHYLASIPRLRRWVRPLERLAGIVMVGLGFLLVTGQFARMTAWLARFSPVVDLGYF
jgi:cytochrome c-type biogenesis protein